MLPDSIDTKFGFALAPLQLDAARRHTADLGSKHAGSSREDLEYLRPVYLGGGYSPQAWDRTLHLVPAATPRSSYSQPLAGGEPGQELPTDTYEQLAHEPKAAEKMPFFQDRVPPQRGPFRIGDASALSTSTTSPPTLVWERLVPHNRSKRHDAKVIVGAHGLGFCKETFLPLLDRLVEAQQDDHGIAEVWLVDALGHGMTAIYNASTIRAVDPQQLLSSQHRIVDSNDYARDLLQFCTFYLPAALDTASRGESIPLILPFSAPRLPARQLVGIGHSFGATSLLQLCVHLPDVFESLCVVEPILVREPLVEKATRVPLARFTLMKPDEWPSRAAASDSFVKDRMLSAWDARVRSAFVAGALFPIEAQSPTRGHGTDQGSVQRCCDRVAEALCVRGNRPGIQLATHTLGYVPPAVKVLYISCAKPLLLPIEEVQTTAKRNIPNLVFETLNGSHSLPLESPDAIADSIRSTLLWQPSSGSAAFVSKL